MKKVLALSFLAFLVVVAFVAWDYWQREAILKEQLRRMMEVVSRLNAEYRVAQVFVRDQRLDASGRILTTVEFREMDRDNHPLPVHVATLAGPENYFEALVVKFDNAYVEKGDALRGRSIILFRRMYGSATAPDEGVPIDPNASDGIPGIYRVAPRASGFEIDLWQRFWYYAVHPDEARKMGVRVLQIEAVAIRPQTNMLWELTVENDGGINIIPLTAAASE